MSAVPCRVSADTRAHLEEQARRESIRDLPDFSQKEFTRQVVSDDLVPAVCEVIEVFQKGTQTSHEALLRACAMLERALLKRYTE